jgi:hypothetical protein
MHWQTVALLLAVVATGSTAVLAGDPAELSGCPIAFVLAAQAGEALDRGVDDVLALSGHPLGAPAGPLPPTVLDYGLEVPAYADHYGGPRPEGARVMVQGLPVTPLAGIGPGERLLTTLAPVDPSGAAVLLGALAAGAGLVLLRDGEAAAVAAAEHVTTTAGTSVQGLTRVA